MLHPTAEDAEVLPRARRTGQALARRDLAPIGTEGIERLTTLLRRYVAAS